MFNFTKEGCIYVIAERNGVSNKVTKTSNTNKVCCGQAWEKIPFLWIIQFIPV